MKRMQLLELEDQAWLPPSIRNGITDFLEFAVVKADLYKPFAPRLAAAISAANVDSVVDLCSGGGGPWLRLRDDVVRLTGREVSVTLTDYYPNIAAFKRVADADSSGRTRFVEASVSALNVSQDLQGLRTVFSAFHHFAPTKAQAILADALQQRQGIVIAESTQRHPLLLAYMLLTPALVLLTSPFQKPFRWSRLFWTYVVPVVPLAVMFDGIVSCLRTYTPDEMMALVRGIPGHETFDWEAGIERIGRLPVGVTYLIGTPRLSMPTAA
ncbi:class I SAM-dependent methyltransferase [Azohydromonas sediminis]|uniref:class I SAM-dependent methyltransferase n=1 Tax=Azohydromonas sediminis TaxID=2259674 RepID=UPI000E652AD1|nr:class I SAM-dependent methyltransferase [Azohydromonas sediminis]